MQGETVRVFQNALSILAELKKKDSQWRMKDGDLGQLNFLRMLLTAHRKKDYTAARKAGELLVPTVVNVDSRIPDFLGRDAKQQAADMLAADAVTDGAHLSSLLTEALKGPQHVVYWLPGKVAAGRRRSVQTYPELRIAFDGKPLRLGILFRDFSTAVAYLMLCNGIKVCLYCHVPFMPKNKRSECCSIEHRNAHKQRRWRERKELEAKMETIKKAAKKGVKRGKR